MMKFIGFVLLALALIAGVLDITRSIADSAVVINRLGDDWFQLSPATLNATQAGIERHVLPALWTVVQQILLLPTWLVLGFLALLFLFFGRKRRASWQEKYGA